jgi:transcriptional regulator with XRE-family HTH domain
MGSKPRSKPERLAEKLLNIRLSLGLSQNEMIRRLDLADSLTQNRISDYELGTREPSLIILLQYARAANVIADVLIDDDLDLPARLPSPTRHDGIKRTSASRRARRASR